MSPPRRSRALPSFSCHHTSPAPPLLSCLPAPPPAPPPLPCAQPDKDLRALVHACYPHLPLVPGANFPSDVRDDGAFPAEPYDFAFWGFPCVKHSSLNRTATEADLVDALDLLEHALRQLSENPPAVFVLENTHSLLSGPRWVLARITTMLRRLPYDWRHSSLIRAPPPSVPPPRAACLPPCPAPLTSPDALRCTFICPRFHFGAGSSRPRLWWVGYLRAAPLH